MLSPSTANLGVEKWISSVEVFHANHILKPEKGEEKMTPETFGLQSLELLAKFDPVSCSWKTSQISLTLMERKSLEIWPKWGFMRFGVLYALPMLAHPIEEQDGFSWHPTPTTVPNSLSPSLDHSKAHLNLTKLFATPTVQDAGKATKKLRVNFQNNLTSQVFNPQKMWATWSARKE
jgi:hypothetical protein